MTEPIRIEDLPEFDASLVLDSEAAIAAFLSDIISAGDAGLLASALGDIARAKGMTAIAQAAGVTREALYRALRPDSNPRFDTIARVCTALGVRLIATVDAGAAAQAVTLADSVAPAPVLFETLDVFKSTAASNFSFTQRPNALNAFVVTKQSAAPTAQRINPPRANYAARGEVH